MNIGFDGKRAANNLTGLGNYSRTLIAQLAKYFPQNQYFVYTPRIKDHPQVQSFFKLEGVQLRFAESTVLWRSWRIVKQLKKEKISLYHGMSQELPRGLNAAGIKAVVTIHDLIYLKFPAYFSFVDRQIYRFKAVMACKHADGVIAISEQTKQDLVERLGVPAEKIRVIYQSCDDSFKNSFDIDIKAGVRRKYKLPTRYLLNVGTIEPRKNLKLIIQALEKLPEDTRLVVIGKPQEYAALVQKEILQLNLSERVLFLQDVSFVDLPVIYQLADVFVYPSFYEGFGIPIIEALYSRIPVIAATGSCLEEAGGPDSLYIDPRDAGQLAAAILKVTPDGALRNQMIEKGVQYAQRFNKENIAAELQNYYLEIMGSTTSRLDNE